MKDFFVSYNQADRQWAEWIAWQLKEAGHEVEIQAWTFRPGQNWVLRMHEAAATCERTLIVLSPSFLAAEYPQPEWAAAFARDAEGRQRALVPVRVADCKPDGMLGQIIYIDLVGLREEAEVQRRLLDGLKDSGIPDVAPPLPEPSPTAAEAPAGTAGPTFPGALPPIWNVPFRRNPNFSGRQHEMERLEAALDSGEAAALCQAIAGMGGVGKTQLAVEYAYRNAGDYEQVWWLRCEEPVTLKSDYAELGRALSLEDPPELDQAVAQVKEWLDRHPGWLLIFDNAGTPDEVRPYLPQGTAGRVLITSRYPAWEAVAKPFKVDLWTPDQSVAFLEKRTGRSEPETAAELAEELGWLPLALEQAAAYIVEKGRSLAGYLKLYREHHLEVLEKGEPGDRNEGTVATTWNLALAEVEEASPAASQLIALCAYLAPEEIPLDVLQEGREHVPEPLQGVLRDELALDEALGALLRYSLIERSGRELSVHRLVQEVVRGSAAEEAAWPEVTVALLLRAFPSDTDPADVRFWPECARLLPHATALLSLVEEAPPEEAGTLLNQMGLYAGNRGQYHEAKAHFERALAIDEAACGPDHPTVAVRVNNLGLALEALGDLEGAKAHYERALAIGEATHGLDSWEVGRYVGNLGMLLQDLGDFEGAKAHCERALAIGEATHGPDSWEVGRYVNRLGVVLRSLGDLKGAKAHFERALAIDEAAYGADHPSVASDVNNLGLVLQSLGDLKGAKAHFERALAIDEAAYGADHPSVASDVNNLGLVLRDLGDLEAAKEHFERALAIFEAAYGPDHSEVGRVVHNLGSAFLALGDFEGAKTHIEQGLEIHEAMYGPDHPTVAIGATSLGLALWKCGDLEGAKARLEWGLEIHEATHGPDHPELATAVNNLGLVLQDLGDLEAAKARFERALAIDEPAYGADHPDVARDVNNLASVLKALGDLEGAEAHFERALAIAARSLGPDHPTTQTYRRNLESLGRGGS